MLSFTIPSVYEALNLVMKNYPDNFNEKAKVEIETLFAHCLDGLSNDSEKFLSTLFIKSLKNYIGATTIDEHIYLRKYEIPQIQLFNILIKEFPFVATGQQITNDIIADLLKNEKEATIIDIGIGQGTQIKNLLGLSHKFTRLTKLKIIGIEPFADALNKASVSIAAFSKDLPFEVEFTGINDFAEKVDFDQFKNERGAVIVNASLALHHIQSLSQRYDVIAKIKNIQPRAFLLIEPNVDHFESNFYRRFQNCYQHFYHIFKVIDRLEIKQDDKNALKLFFGREIEDIMGKKEEDRYERHEPAYRWIEKLKQTGFNIVSKFPELPSLSKTGINIDVHEEGFLGFTYGSETILSIIYAA